MKYIELHGRLGQKFGRHYDMDVASPAMAVQGLISMLGPSFKQALSEGRWLLIKGDVDRTPKSNKVTSNNNFIDEDTLPMKTSHEKIHIIPAVQGSGNKLKTIIGVALVVAAVVFTGGAAAGASTGLFGTTGWGVAAANIGLGLAMGGVAGMLAPTPTLGNYTDAEDTSKPSFIPNGAINVTTQGGPVPLVYGQFRVGSVVINAGLKVEQLGDSTTREYNYLAGWRGYAAY